MTIYETQKLLKNMYKEVYSCDPVIQANVLELGYAIKRLLDCGEINLLDSYDDNKDKIFKEFEFQEKWYTELFAF